MMMDSYNMYYDLKDEEPQNGLLNTEPKGPRAKLFYKYTQGDNGYKVGPSNDSSATDGYYYWASHFSVKTDSDIDTIYYPGNSQKYWLSSPSANSFSHVMLVYYKDGGFVYYNNFNNDDAFCPLVSLKPSTQLELEGL